MGKKDQRTPAEKAAWEASLFTDEEAAAVGDTAARLNALHTAGEQEGDNPIAPPS